MQLHKARFHFVGIGGIGMCGLAELLHNMGAKVSGSDLSENANTERLKQLGVKIFKGHKAENVGDADVVVYSSAVQFSNPEMSQSRALGIPLIPRAEALAEIMRLKRGIAVGGTHGKTTTASMVASIFISAQTKPTIVVGGRFDLIQSTALLGDGEWLIAEADESDGSFHKLSPEIAIITNVDSDHLDHFKTFENLQRSFFDFALKVPFYGVTIVCGDDAKTRELFANYPKRILFYGFDESNDFVLKGEKGHYEIFEKNGSSLKSRGSFELHVPGKHNALNATAALLVGLNAGIPFETCVQGLLKFQGVDRRFHFKGEAQGIKVYDDYGHHPTEVRATLEGFREKFPDSRLIVYFQPHRYSRTESCWSEFTRCFDLCDQLYLTDIYPAGEKPIEGITSVRLSEEIQERTGKAQYVPRQGDSLSVLRDSLQAGDVFVTLGAGDGWKVGLELLQILKDQK